MDDDDDDLFGDVPAVRRPAKKPKPSTSLLDSFMVADAKKASRLESLRLQNAASREKVASISESKEPCCEPGGGAAAPQLDWDYIRRGAGAAPPPAKKLVDGSDDEDGVGGALDDEVYEAVIGATLPEHLGSPDEATAAKLLAQARFELSRDAGAARECKDSNAVALAEYGLLEAFAQLAAEDDDAAAAAAAEAGSPRRRPPDATARLVEALEEAYGAHYVTTQRGLGAARECKDSNAVALAEYGLLEAFAQLAAEDDDAAAAAAAEAGSPRRRPPDATARLVEALEEAYGAHYVTTQRELGAAAGLRKLDVGAALIRWLQLLVAFDARDAVAYGAAETLAKLAETHDAATRPLLTPDVVTLVLRHYVKAPLDLGEALGGAGPGSTRDGNAPAPRRLARCLGVWAACVDAGAAALDAPALAALGKVCAGVIAPDAAVHDCRGCRAAARHPRQSWTAASGAMTPAQTFPSAASAGASRAAAPASTQAAQTPRQRARRRGAGALPSRVDPGPAPPNASPRSSGAFT